MEILRDLSHRRGRWSVTYGWLATDKNALDSDVSNAGRRRGQA